MTSASLRTDRGSLSRLEGVRRRIASRRATEALNLSISGVKPAGKDCATRCADTTTESYFFVSPCGLRPKESQVVSSNSS